ncbi:MAG: hypothetical protein MUC77_21370 [Chromatiaceae bacterium]|jgi:hypothetical protein|nr:hypothetical protein [Chromatiaceae bacterium]
MNSNKPFRLPSRLGLALALVVGGAAGTAAVLAAGAEPVREAQEWICRVPPEGLDKAARVAAGAAPGRQTDQGRDWLPNQAGECFAERGSSGDSEAFELLVCLDRPGRSMGTQVESSRTGRIRSRPMGCELAENR